MYRNRFAITLLLALFHLLWPGSDTEAYKEPTHRDLSKKAIQYSCLQDADYLKSIGIISINETFNGDGLIQWIELGAEEEDSGIRSRHHFHNPRLLWADAGLDDFFTGQSSLLWAQEASNEFSWQNARQYFHDALTSSSAKSRETGFANTFETLGHLLHLVQDCACPPHTRNDAHVFIASGYEGWAKNYRDEVLSYASPFVVDVDLGVSVEGYEPITQLFDANRYTTEFAPSTSNTQGLAEYTNANFASEDTIFTENRDRNDDHYFPFPGRADTVEYEEDMGGRVRTYFRKTQSGEVIEHFAVAGRFYRYLPWWPEVQVYFIGFDDQCHNDYAEKLLPRAAGYSSKLLNYFFRGRIDMVPDCETGSGCLILNNHDTEAMNGTFELYSDNMIGGETIRELIWSGSFELGAKGSGNNQSGNVSFPAPDNAKEPGKYILVFRGQMGSETDAVVGKVVDGIRTCGGYALITSGSYVTVWNFATNAVAIDVTLNAGGVAIFPCLTADISDWVAGLDTWSGWNVLFTEQADDGSYGSITETSGSGWIEGNASRTGVLRTHTYYYRYDYASSFEEGGELTGHWERYSNTSSGSARSSQKRGIKLTALNGSGEEIEIAVSYSYSSTSAYSYNLFVPPEGVWGTADCNQSSTETNSVTSTGAYFAGINDSGTQVCGRSANVTEEFDPCNWPYCTCLNMAGPVTCTGALGEILSQYIDNCSYYNENSKIILQMFTIKSGSDFDAYGTSDTGLADIGVAPSTLSEKAALSAALLALIQQSTNYSIGVTFKQ